MLFPVFRVYSITEYLLTQPLPVTIGFQNRCLMGRFLSTHLPKSNYKWSSGPYEFSATNVKNLYL